MIHRDIKPGNILVTEEGEPKLLDFGIAKVMSKAQADDTTRTAHPALTLDYASPEQVRGDPVTTSSDVYSLGVVLYELLTDRKPYQVEAGSLTDAIRLVCETRPPAPSTVAPPERRSELAGDLDAVVGKAMEKVRADRYASVAELAADLASHLGHLPVRARRPSFGYLARKFVRRHRTPTAVAAIVLALLAFGVVAVLWQARVAEHERARAQQRFDQVRQLANYVIFDLQDGIANLAGSTELRRTMVERSLAYLDSLAGEARGDADLQMELAGAYTRLGNVLGQRQAANLGDHEGALRSYGKARELLNQVVSRQPGHADARRSLGRLLLSIHSAQQGDPQKETPGLLSESMAIWEALVREDPRHEDNLRGLASAHFAAFRPTVEAESAGPHMERALEIFETLLAMSPQDPVRKRNVALCHKHLAGHFMISDPESQRGLRHASMAAHLDSERLAARPHDTQAKLDYTFALSTLGDYYYNRRDWDEALRHFEQALALRRELWNGDQANVRARDRLAYMFMRVAEVHILAGRYGRAAPFLDESIAHARAVQGHDWQALLTLSKAYLFRGEVVRGSNGSPCPWYRRMAELLPRVPGTAVKNSYLGETATLRDGALARLKSCPG